MELGLLLVSLNHIMQQSEQSQINTNTRTRGYKLLRVLVEYNDPLLRVVP
jgi:hypothetical protein